MPPRDDNGNGKNGVFVKWILGIVAGMIVAGSLAVAGASLVFWNETSKQLTQLQTTKTEESVNVKLHNDIEVRLRLLEENYKKIDSKLDKIDTKLDDITSIHMERMRSTNASSNK